MGNEEREADEYRGGASLGASLTFALGTLPLTASNCFIESLWVLQLGRHSFLAFVMRCDPGGGFWVGLGPFPSLSPVSFFGLLEV